MFKTIKEVELKSNVAISFIIVNYFLSQKVLASISSIKKFTTCTFEIIVVDNSNNREEALALQNLLGDAVQIIDPHKNLGFGAGCNLGAKYAKGEYIFLLNPDARLIRPFAENFVKIFESNASIGVIGGRLVGEDGSEIHSTSDFPGLKLPLKRLKGSLVFLVKKLFGLNNQAGPKLRIPPQGKIVDSVYGADMMIRAEDYRILGGFDERYFLYGEEVDLQFRLKKLLNKLAIAVPIDIFHEDGGTNIPKIGRWIMIECGALRFVHTHRSRLVFRSYWAMMCILKLAEVFIASISLDRQSILFHSQILFSIFRWNPKQYKTFT